MMFLPILFDTLFVALIAAVVLVVVKRDRHPGFALLFVGVYAGARIVNLLPHSDLLGLHPEGLMYNWVGHVFMIVWVLIVARFAPLRARDIGLTLRQRSGTVLTAVLVTLGVVVFKGGLALLLSGGQPDSLTTETLLFQITVPPLAQELVYSGLLLSLMYVALVFSTMQACTSVFQLFWFRSQESSYTPGCDFRPAALCSRFWRSV